MLRSNICTWLILTTRNLSIFACSLLLVILPSLLSAAEIHKTVSILFNGDLANLPVARTQYECDTTTIFSEDVLHILGNYHTVYISRQFDDNDSGFILIEGPEGTMLRQPTLKGSYTLTFQDSIEASAAVLDLLHSEDIIAANQDGMIELNAVIPNDPLFSQQWGLNNEADADIDAPEAWEYEKGSAQRKIAVFDCGVWAGHPDLQGRVSGDGIDANSPSPYHGTLVAGVACANTNNGIGVAGLDWHASIISKDIYGTTWDDVGAKIASAVGAGANVLNYSFESIEPTLPYQLGSNMAYAYNQGRVCVASAGNDGSNGVNYPAEIPKVISVAASDINDEITSFSHYGNTIDVMAPGDAVLSTNSPTTPYDDLSATSMSSAHVSGLATLLKAHWPVLDNEDIRNIIQSSSDTRQGYRRISAENAFEIMQAPNWLLRDSDPQTFYHKYIVDKYFVAWRIPGFAAQNQYVEQYTVRSSVAFPKAYVTAPMVWGRAGTTGLMDAPPTNPATTLWDYRDCRVVSGPSTTGVVLETYVYKRFNILGQFIGWYPCEPQDVIFHYSVLGESVLDEVTTTTVTPDFANERARIEWNDPNPNEERFVIDRRQGNYGEANWGEWETVGTDVTSIYQSSTDQLVGSQIYYYRVRPYTYNQNNINEGPEPSFRNLPQSPQNVSVWSSTYQGYPMPKTFVSWSAPANQLANSIDHYEVKVQYSPTDIRWYDTTATTLEFCADYDEEIQVTVYAVDDWDVQSRASSTVNFETPPMYQWTNCIPPGGGGNLVVSDSGEIGKLSFLPTEFSLEQNYPNPFNPSTSIAFSLPAITSVRIEVFNALGQHIKTLYDGNMGVGRHEFQWDGRDDTGKPVGSGVYLYRIDAGAFSESRKMLLLK